MSIELGLFPSPAIVVHDQRDAMDENPTFGGRDADVDEDRVEEDSDIYRGDPPPRPASPEDDSSSSASSTTSSSSDGSVIGRRLGAIAAVVEHAIARWARTNVSISDAASVSSESSIRTVAKSVSRRRRRRPSIVSLQNYVHSEREVAARLKAREESRYIPREFTLYLPKSLCHTIALHGGGDKGVKRQHPDRVARTTSLPLVLNHLDAALKKSTKTPRTHDRAATVPARPHLEYMRDNIALRHHDYMIPNDLDPTAQSSSFPDATLLTSAKKGKRKENGIKTGRTSPSSRIQTSAAKPRQSPIKRAWWLDVASPTWEDMKAIGELLHLHPLTLEDILQQDPREKLELFPKLGYYFIVFKALEGHQTQERFLRTQALITGDGHLPRDGGYAGEAMVYLVVFREGVVSFHFSDISEHTDRVRNKLLLLDESVNVSNASSDWIAHGLLDSIVDSFFPFQEELEKEIGAIEDLVFSDNHKVLTENPMSELIVADVGGTDKQDEKTPNSPSPSDEKKSPPTGLIRTQFALPTPTIPLLVRRLRRSLRSHNLFKTKVSMESKAAASAAAMTLRRMAKARRLFTTSTRLLNTKHEVVAQIKKRLLTEGALPKGTGAGDEIEVAIYMGDVQDHILSLQHSLVHYERILVQLHQTYLSQLRVSVSTTKQGIDKAIVILTTVSMAVLCCQVVIGCFSTNVNVPTNGHDPAHPYNWFYAVVAVLVVVLFAFAYIIRLWWIRANRKRRVALK